MGIESYSGFRNSPEKLQKGEVIEQESTLLAKFRKGSHVTKLFLGMLALSTNMAFAQSDNSTNEINRNDFESSEMARKMVNASSDQERTQIRNEYEARMAKRRAEEDVINSENLKREVLKKDLQEFINNMDILIKSDEAVPDIKFFGGGDGSSRQTRIDHLKQAKEEASVRLEALENGAEAPTNNTDERVITLEDAKSLENLIDNLHNINQNLRGYVEKIDVR